MDIKSLEHPTLKVPYEILNKKFRAGQKVIDREANHVANSLAEVDRLLTATAAAEEGDPAVAIIAGEEKAAMLRQLDALKQQLQQLKAKSVEAVEEEVGMARILGRRVDHLKEGCSPDSSPVHLKQWRKVRLDRMLVEHFLRSGLYDTAIQLSQTTGIQDLTNLEVFLTAKEVEESLQAGDITKCLAWCYDNKSKLRKMKSSLEFNVRLQEFVELVKKGNRLEAVRHAKKYLATDENQQLGLVQQGMGMLAFPLDTPIQPYRDLLDSSRWQALIEQFRTENFRLHQLSNQSVFSVALQSGMSSLKTPHCYRQNQFVLSSIMPDLRPRAQERNIECPVCHPALNTLAIALPYAHCSQSRLVCFLSGKPLNENNVPMMLPNGNVYGEQALLKMSKENEGQIVCPRTKEIYAYSELEKVYVM